MLTAAGGVADRVAGLALGADDYLAKPFAFAELVGAGAGARPAGPAGAAAGAGARRHPPGPAPPRGLPRRALRARCRARSSRSSRSCCGPTARWSRAEQLLEKAWDEHIDPFTNVVRVTVMKLRRKLGDPPVIETVPGVGYQIR